MGLGSFLEGIGKDIVKPFEDVGSALKDGGEAFGALLHGNFSEAGEDLKDAGEKAVEGVVGIGMDAATIATGGAAGIGMAVMKEGAETLAKDGIVAAAKDTGSSLISAAKDKASSVFTSAKDVGSDAASAVKNGTVREFGTDLTNKGVTKLTSSVTDAGKTIGAAAQGDKEALTAVGMGVGKIAAMDTLESGVSTEDVRT